jgi:tetratricopeptide (TPR) repeat protein
MADEQVQKLIQGAIAAVKQGDKPLARRAFLQAVKLDPRHEGAWLGLASTAEDNREKLLALQNALRLNPNNPRTLDMLAKLGITPEQLLNATPSAPEAPQEAPPAEEQPKPKSLKALRSTTETPAIAPVPAPEPAPAFQTPEAPETNAVEEAPAPVQEALPPLPDITLEEAFGRALRLQQGDGGVPIPPQKALLRAKQEALIATQAYLDGQRQRPSLTWSAKPSGRAGEREITILQLQIVAGVFAFVIVFGGLLLSFALNNPDVQRLIFAPTWTLSPTPTSTSTPTPGVTPTPSPTPELTLTPSPTLPAGIATRDALYYVPYPTQVYAPPGVPLERNIELANQALNSGRVQRAFELLDVERRGTEQNGSFMPYFYIVAWHLRQNDPVSARTALIEGETRWRERSNDARFQPLIDVATANVLLAEARDALAKGGTLASVRTALTEATTRLDAAIAYDPRFVEAYIRKSERFLIENNTDEALRVLNEALLSDVIPNAPANAELRLARAQIYAQLGQNAAALQELNTVLLLEPYAIEALRLQVRVALNQRDYGTAVIYAEQYMARYPGSVEAVKLRGDAWRAEGKLTLALEQYERALTGDSSDPAYIETLLARAELWEGLGAHERAYDDLTEALRLSGNAPRVRFARMNAALKAGNFTVARTDSELLAESPPAGVLRGDLLLVQARVLLELGENNPLALQLLGQAQTAGVSNAPLLDELLARANLNARAFDVALEAINRALRAEENGTRRYLRGQIYEARADNASNRANANADLERALRDYEFILTWSEVYPYPFLQDVRERYETLRTRLA